MHRYRIEALVTDGGAAPCRAREWRVRWATGELRRRGFRVLLDRFPREPEDACLFVLKAASRQDALLVAELAELGDVRVVEEPERRAVI